METSQSPLVVHAPLPKGYDCNSVSSICTYAEEVMAFLKRYMFIHTSHPDRFFEMVLQNRISRLPESIERELLSSMHENKKEGNETENRIKEAIQEIKMLCMCFGQEFTARGSRLQHYTHIGAASAYHKKESTDLDNTKNLDKYLEQRDDIHPPLTYEEHASLIQEGPRNAGLLKDFFDMTERLKLHRLHTEYPNPVETLFPERKGKFQTNATDAAASISREYSFKEGVALCGEERVRVRNALLGKGMCSKKKHEVSIMDDTIRATLSETLRANGGDTKNLTVMNVGEGKGYVSRVLSICEATPVVGIDCNPLHKEVALDRLEPILEVANATDKSRKQILNLNYCNRGRTTCVTCRVGPDTDWVDVLNTASVPICDESGNLVQIPSTSTHFSCGPHTDNNDDIATHVSNVTQDGIQAKVVCSVCQKVIRYQNGAPLVKHIRQHIDHIEYKKRESGKEGSERQISLSDYELKCAELPIWAAALSPEQLANKVLVELFVPFVDPSTTTTAKKRTRGDGEPNDTTPCFVRATDVAIGYFANKPKPQTRINRKRDDKIENTDQKFDDSKQTDIKYHGRVKEYVERRGTILGYDDGSERYKVFVHEDPINGGLSSPIPQNGIVSGKSTMLKLSARKEISTPNTDDKKQESEDFEGVVTFNKIEPIPYIVHPITAPSLSSVLLMGLHTCGDLGAAICKLYRSSDAPSLVLVSCCWHALTSSGFPLSKQLKKDSQFSTNSLSLMLATQPLESFANSSSEEHFGSSRLLFYRSMFSLIWEDIRLKCGGGNDESDKISSYEFAQHRPVLDRSFLRSLAKDKNTMTFVEFCKRVRDQIMKKDDYLIKIAKSLENKNDEQRHINVLDQINFYLFGPNGTDDSTDSAYIKLAMKCEEMYFDKYYSAFIGFTTLRTWMSHLLEGLLLIDRLLYLCETSTANEKYNKERLSLVPLFDGTLSPRMFAIIGIKECTRKPILPATKANTL